MKLGAQLYSVRHQAQNEADLAESFRRLREIGYEFVQLSGVADTISAEYIGAISREYALPITSTHTKFDRILSDTARVIEEHKAMGAETVGLGWLAAEYRTEEGFAALKKMMQDPIARILDAGLRFSYHNHAFEFESKIGDALLFDAMIDTWEGIDFIPDTYWIAFGGYDPIHYIKKIGGQRIKNIHFKDMAKDEARSICACGDGVLDFAAIANVCREEKIEYVLVEQDNAPSFPDAFEEMAKSYRHLKDIVLA